MIDRNPGRLQFGMVAGFKSEPWPPSPRNTRPASIGICTLVLEMPGVEKKDINVDLENNVLRVAGKIDFAKYEGMEPVYTEYNVGHYTRSFTLSNKINQEQISAQLEDGVLTLTLPKVKDAQPKRIAIN
jgi:HSP20 family molecular chaperone IbpA